MLTLTYGFKKPQDGDKGTIFFDALEDNITRVDGHTHNGTDSSLLPTASFNNTTQTISSGSWSAVSGKAGLYKQVVTMPTGLTYDGRGIFFKDSTTGDMYMLTVEKESSNTYSVYINDNTKSLIAVYV